MQPRSETCFVGTEPYKAHPTDAGYDLYAAIDIEIGHGVTKIPTGTKVAIPEGYVGLVKDRSSMAARGFHVVGGVIDHGYTGEIQVMMTNSGLPELVARGQKVAQLVIIPCLTAPLRRVDRLEPSERGDGGFGSTGI